MSYLTIVLAIAIALSKKKTKIKHHTILHSITLHRKSSLAALPFVHLSLHYYFFFLIQLSRAQVCRNYPTLQPEAREPDRDGKSPVSVPRLFLLLCNLNQTRNYYLQHVDTMRALILVDVIIIISCFFFFFFFGLLDILDTH